MALGSRGDVEPYLRLGSALRQAGHRAWLVSTRDFRPLATERGIEFVALPADAREVVHTADGNMRALVLGFARVAGTLPGAADLVLPAAESADVIVNQLPGGAFGVDLAERYGLRHWRAATIPLEPTAVFPMIGWPQTLSGVPGYNRITYRVSDLLVWLLLRTTVNKWRAVLDLPPRSVPALSRTARQDMQGVLLASSPHVLPQITDWPDSVHVTGYWSEPRQDWKPPERLRKFLDHEQPVVFVGFGSMPVEDPAAVTSMVIEAARTLGCRLVLGAGWAGLGEDVDSEAVFVLREAPYDWLFPRMAGLVHHGGSGTTGAALRSGVPSAIVPFLFDQSFWGRRVADLGVGPRPIPVGQLSTGRLKEALTVCLEDERVRSQAERLAAKLGREDGLSRAVRIVEQDLGADGK